MTLHFEIVSAGKVADLQRVGMFSSLGEFSISLYSHATLKFFKARMDLCRAALESYNKEGIWYKIFLYRFPLSVTLFDTELVEQLFQQAATQARSISFLLGFSKGIKRKSTSLQSHHPSKKEAWSQQGQFIHPQQAPMYSQQLQQLPVPSGQTLQLAFPQQ